MTKMESYFKKFRDNIVGINKDFKTPYGTKRIIYSDWIASGRLYHPIESKLLEMGELLGNTHTETTVTGKTMTQLYNLAKKTIKKHANATDDDILIASGAGMTGVVNKFQRILGLKVHEKLVDKINFEKNERPVVFITHMEHHSNQTSWLETICDVELINPDKNGQVDLEHFESLLKKYEERPVKIASVTHCSNVTGIQVPVHKIAAIIHKAGGYCFVDYACSAPYVDINMNPEKVDEKLDAIYFSPHKFLGGPGSSGVLIFNSELYNNKVPDHPGGGTVDWTNPWGDHKYHDDIELKEDGGTPPFLQTIKAALAIKLKEEMGADNILKREEHLLDLVWDRFLNIRNLHLLADNCKERLGVFSFYIDGLHYNLGVKLLNDKFGIQTRGGCSCAGTYGHYLLNIDEQKSHEITEKINQGLMSFRPGWIRMSIHPTLTDEEVMIIMDAIEDLAANFEEWGKDYEYDETTNEFFHKKCEEMNSELVLNWFNPNN